MTGHPSRWSVPRLLAASCSPTVATTVLALVLAATGGHLTLLLPHGSTLLPGPEGAGLHAAVLALLVALVVAELAQANVEIRQQSYSFSLVGLPLVLGLLYLPPTWVVAARLASALAAFAVQRPSWTKVVYNSAAYLLDVALVSTLLHLVATSQGRLGVRTAVAAYLSLAVVDVLMTALVLLVIRVNVGPLERGDLTTSFGHAAVTVALATSLGLLCVVLVEHGPVGWVLLGLVCTGASTAYRGYLVLRRRHSDLRLVQGFIDDSAHHEGGDVLAAQLLKGLRELLRAETARLVWCSREGEVQVHGSSQDATRPLRPLSTPPPGTEGLVPAGTTDPPLRSWLEDLGAREALVVDLRRFGGNGMLVFTDHLGGEVSRFSEEDLRLAGALAGHLVVRMRNTELVDRLRWEATHDTMTGLPNRRVLLSALELFLGPRGPRRGADDGRGAGPADAAVLVMVVDRLGEVNDALGHDVGDLVVVEVARRLSGLRLPGATVARLSGEHFAVAVPAVRAGGLPQLAERLRSVTADPVTLPDAVVSVGVRVGIASAADDDALDAPELLRRADAALAAARTDDRQVVLYSRSLDSGRTERLALLGDLHRAVDEGLLRVHYQPKLDLLAGRVTAVEALVRWDHPVIGPVSPAVFVPLAESAGLVDRLTDLVLGSALERVRAWAADGLDLAVAVNLSARSLDDASLPDRVLAALHEAGVSADRLVLEITETSLMGDPERTLPVLHRLARMGIALSLDDFGTGYSSLAYLQRLPVCELKVDRSFVLALEDPSASGSRAIVSGILGLAAALGLSVVAEGVESARALAALRDLGCRHVQGFLVSRPVPPGSVPDVVRAIDADPAFPSPPVPPQRARALPAGAAAGTLGG